VLETD